MSDEKQAPSSTPVVPAVTGLIGAGIMTMGFGAGYGARAWNNSEAKRELLEKFPEQPTLEAEAMARRGAFRALAAGTALAGLMGVGAVVVARSYGISNVQQFGEEIKRWLPTKDELQACAGCPIGPPPQRGRAPDLSPAFPCSPARAQGTVQPKLEPLQRTITEHVQGGRAVMERKIQNSSLGKDIAARTKPKAEKELEPWEKELLAKLDMSEKPATSK